MRKRGHKEWSSLPYKREWWIWCLLWCSYHAHLFIFLCGAWLLSSPYSSPSPLWQQPLAQCCLKGETLIGCSFPHQLSKAAFLVLHTQQAGGARALMPLGQVCNYPSTLPLGGERQGPGTVSPYSQAQQRSGPKLSYSKVWEKRLSYHI